MQRFYLVKQGNKTIGVQDNNKSLIIGFKSQVLARHVQYSMHPEQVLVLNRSQSIQISVNDKTFENINIDPAATVKLTKWNAFSSDHTGFHLATLSAKQFFAIPFTKQIGIIIPKRIEDESEKEMVLTCDLVDPYCDFEIYKNYLEL
jgi:hypothetical protein